MSKFNQCQYEGGQGLKITTHGIDSLGGALFHP